MGSRNIGWSNRNGAQSTPTAIDTTIHRTCIPKSFLGPGNRFRVLYDIDEVAHEVYILAIGEKERDRLLVAGEDVEI